MIDARDRVALAPGVELAPGRVVDAARAEAWPLNASAVLLLANANGCRVAVLARSLEHAYGLSPERSVADTVAFCARLNDALLLNVRAPLRRRALRWLLAAAALAPLRRLPPPLACRRHVDTRSFARAFLTAFAAAARFAAVAAALVALAVAALTAPLGMRAAGLAVTAGVGTGFAVCLHEAGHAIALRGVPAALVARGAQLFVLHPCVSGARQMLVAGAGPAAAVVAGLAVALASTTLRAHELVPAALPLLAHSLGLTVLSRDGRRACGLS